MIWRERKRDLGHEEAVFGLVVHLVTVTVSESLLSFYI
jgi:hypothetical protein